MDGELDSILKADKPVGIALSSVLKRIIWLCMLPLFLFATGISVYQVNVIESEQADQAAVLAENIVLKIDNSLNARINALNILAVSPLMDDPARWNDLYQLAEGFYKSFGTHVVITDGGTPTQLLLDTRVHFGTKLPVVEKPNGRLAGPIAMRTGKPAVSDLFLGPVAKKPLLGIAVPAIRDGKTKYAILTTMEKGFFQKRIEGSRLPSGWCIILRDAEGEIIASVPQNFTESLSKSSVVNSQISHWTVTVGIFPNAHWAPLINAGIALGVALFGVTLAGFLGGQWTGRRLGSSIASLAKARALETPKPDILEIAVVRQMLDNEANMRAAVEKTLLDSQEALLESERKIRFALETAGMGGWDLNLEDHTTHRSELHDNIFGYRDLLPEWSYEKFLEHVHPDDRDRVESSFVEAVSGGRNWNTECRIHRPDGDLRWIWLTGRHFRNERDGAPHMAGFVQDITDRKIAEEEKEKLEKQLLQAQKMESVGILAGGVAHDYNNMLNVILGYSEMALEEIDRDQPLYDDLTEILNAAKRSAEITRQLLAFARKQTIDPMVLDLNETISGMLKMLQRLIGENISLSWNPNPKLWYIKMDPSQIDQILANLCVNARDAINDVGKITIETDNTILDEYYCAKHIECIAGEYVMLSVSDTGCGMDKETLERVFEPFYTTKGVGRGTGLGMSTVYGIIKQNNGSINIYSELGTGTTIRIYIPRDYSEEQTVAAEETHTILKGEGEIILIVEDESTVRKMGKIMLERSGYRVLTAASPSETFSVVENHAGEIDLLITDVVMPEMNGRELANQLQSLYPEIRVLFMSGYTANAIAHHGVIDKGVNFIQKPFSHKDLASKVRKILDGGLSKK